MATGRSLCILLVEDHPDHAEVILRALEDRAGVQQVSWVKDGEEALDFLHRRGPYADPTTAPRPGLILLDLKLPKVGGQEVLRRIKADAELATIPVVIVSTSEREKEVGDGYRVGADGFVTKAARIGRFIERIRAIDFERLSCPDAP